MYIGSSTRIIHRPCDFANIEEHMDELLNSYIMYRAIGKNKWRYRDNFVHAIIRHFYFEYIHPFCDGNGRLGRMMLYSELVYYLPDYISYSLSEAIYKDIQTYYSRLGECEQPCMGVLDVTTFIEYILEKMVDSFTFGMNLTDRQLEIYRSIPEDGITYKDLVASYDGLYSETIVKEAISVAKKLNLIVDKYPDGEYGIELQKLYRLV